MELFTSTTSPYVRKVYIVLEHLGLLGQVVMTPVNPHQRPAVLTMHNPLSKIPTLVLDSGEVIPDSELIVSYFLEQYPSEQLLPMAEKWEVLKLCKFADGIVECGIKIFLEKNKPPHLQSEDVITVNQKDIEKCLLFLNTQSLSAKYNLFHINLMCALDFLNFRLPEMKERWMELAPSIAAWYGHLSQVEVFKRTYPHIA